MTQPRKLYLAGPISKLSYDKARFGWRWTFTELLAAQSPHIECYSPMRAKEFLANEQNIGGDADYCNSVQNAFARPRGIITRDHHDVKTCDAIVACFLDSDPGVVSIGTVWELGAAYAYSKPVVAVMERDNVHQHIFVTETSGYVVETLEEAALIVGSILTPGR